MRRSPGTEHGGSRPQLLPITLLAAALAAVLCYGYLTGGSPGPTAAGPGDAAAAAGAPPGVAAVAEFPATGPITPARLVIPAIGVDADVESRGTTTYRNPFTGEQVQGYGVPESMHTTSWWSDGPLPGSGPMAVVLGHQDAGSGPAIFDDLTRLRPGDEVRLRAVDGATLQLQVLGSPVTGLDKATSALADTLNGHPPRAAVALVTCGGEFDDEAGASEANTVVFASLGSG